MVATAFKIFVADAIGNVDDFDTLVGASKIIAVTPTGLNSPFTPSDVTHDNNTSYIETSTANDEEWWASIDTSFVEKMATVVSVNVYARVQDPDQDTVTSVRLRVRINATNVQSGVFTVNTSGGWLDRTVEGFARPGGGDWTEDDFKLTGSNKFEFGIFRPSQSPKLRDTSLWCAIEYIPLNQNIETERERASRRLWYSKEADAAVTVVGGWEHLEAELMDPVAYAHADGPTHDALGWGVKDWQRGIGVLRGQEISLSVSNVIATIADRRRKLLTYGEIFKTSIASDPDVADGLPRLDCAGADREFSRASSAWVEEVSGLIKDISSSKEKLEPAGELIEGTVINYVLESSFVNGKTGWTEVTTTGSATFALDTADLKFESDVTPNSYAITATAATHDVEITDVTSNLTAGVEHTLSVEGKSSLASGAIHVHLQNDSTGNWLNSGGTWQASRPATPPLSFDDETANTISRVQFTFDADITTATHTIVVNCNGTVNGTVYRTYHVQIEQGTWMSSRIVTAGAQVLRILDNLLIRNDSSLAQRIWPVDKFTLKIVFTPQWNAADLNFSDIALILTLLELFHDANNQIIIQTTSSTLSCDYEHASTVETASFSSPSFVRDTEHTIVVRRTSSSGELGLANNTLSIFFDGVKGGTEDTISAALTQTATSVMQIGARSTNVDRHANGWFAEIAIYPVVYSDAEIAGGLP